MKRIKLFENFGMVKEALAVSPKQIMADISQRLGMNVDSKTETIQYFTMAQSDHDRFTKSVKIKNPFMKQNGEVKATVDLFDETGFIGTQVVDDLESFLQDFFER